MVDFAVSIFFLFFFKTYFIIFRERGKEGERGERKEREGGKEAVREGEKHQCVVASRTAPHWGLGLQPRPVPWLGI